jgi:hypothetical protein
MDRIIILIAAMLFQTGCATMTITAAHVTHPVLLGKPAELYGAESEQREMELFDITVPSKPSWNTARNLDSEMLKRIDSAEDIVIIDQMRVVSSIVLIFIPAYFLAINAHEFIEAGISGGIYGLRKGDHEKK